MASVAVARNRKSLDTNKLHRADQPVHGWYRFVLSFPPHLVREYLHRFGGSAGQRVLDPFCGTGTTLVECKRVAIKSVGIEANPVAHFASEVKVDWAPDADGLVAHAEGVAAAAVAELASQGIDDIALLRDARCDEGSLRTLPPEAAKLLLKDSISPLPLHKALVLLDAVRGHHDDRYSRHESLALAAVLPSAVGNLEFGPEVGVGPPKTDAAVVDPWLTQVRQMARDLRGLGGQLGAPAVVHLADARRVVPLLGPRSIDAVITSPPYPNEKDYTRITRLEAVLLGFIRDRADLQGQKRHLMRSNTRNVYKGDDDDTLVAAHAEVQRIADQIEARRVALGKTSGFERLYPRVVKLYFGGMTRHLADLRPTLRPGAQLAYVVGDQASYLRVMIRTGQLLADIAQSLGYELIGIDLFRTRLATATREQLREETVVLRWPGEGGGNWRGCDRALAEKHYRLVPPEQVSPEDLESYRKRSD